MVTCKHLFITCTCISAPEVDDLASVVKSRRLLAAKAEEERKQRESRERQRRELEAKIELEEKALARVEHDETVAVTDHKLACRAQLLGTDRCDRRYWRFTCAPSRVFVESNWGPEAYLVGNSLITEHSQVDSLPPSHIIPEEALASLEPVRRFGYAARSNWFVFDQPEELDNLADALVERGIRESQLRKNLVQSGLLGNLKELIALSRAEESNDVVIVESSSTNGSAKTPDEYVVSLIYLEICYRIYGKSDIYLISLSVETELPLLLNKMWLKVPRTLTAKLRF